MDLQSFLESGLMEAYVLGQCTAGERAEVERMASLHPEVKAELEAIERTLEKVARANAVPPPPGLKDQIMLKIDPSSVAGPRGPGFRGPALGWAAAALLAVVLAGLWYWSGQKEAELNARIAGLQTQIDRCREQTGQQNRLQAIIALLRDRDTRTIVLRDNADAAKITATVWHNTVRQETVLDVKSLPPPDPGRYFQFWAIVEGQPVSMGMVQLGGSDSWQTLTFVENAQAFAISSEDKPGGNPAPTQVVLVGPV